MIAADVPPWSVLWAFDPATAPNKWKLWVAVGTVGNGGLFLRINSRSNRPGSVLLPKASHPFLPHDSYMGCGGDPIEVSDAELADAMAAQTIPERRGIQGVIAPGYRLSVCIEISQSRRMTGKQRRLALLALGCP